MPERRDLSLELRLEDTREKKDNEITRFSLEEIKGHFEENLAYIQQQYAVAQRLISEGSIDDGENVWRSQIIFLDSAFDFYLHEITQYGLRRIFLNYWEKTEKYNNLKVKMPFLEKAIEAVDDKAWFDEYTNREFSQVPMMSYEVVKDQLNLLGIHAQKIADKAFYRKGATEKTLDKLKRRISELYSRRNLIAHQSDRKLRNAEREKISEEEVKEFVEDIKKIVYSIHKAVAEKDKETAN